jgi:hypothetical protein
MKLVREHINEKFIEDSDPIRDMGIGIYGKPKNFKSTDEIVDFLIECLPAILKTNKIPKNIIYLPEQGSAFNWQYYEYLDKYIKKYLTINNKETRLEAFLINFWHRLLKMGYGVSNEEMKNYNQ